MLTRRISYLILAGIVLSAFCSCQKGGSKNSGSLIIEPVRVQESLPVINIPGVLLPRDKVEVKASSAGKIAEVFVNKGDAVVEGTPLAKFSEEDVSAKMNQLKAAKKEAETHIEKNQSLFKNRDKLLEEGKLDKNQFEALSLENAANESTLERIKADMALLESKAGRAQMTSPIKGIVTERYASPLQVAAEEQVLFVITNTDPILVSFQLTSDEASGIKIGQPVSVKIDDLNGEEYNGTISFIGPEISQDGRTFEVLASISNPEHTLKAGMFAGVQLTSAKTHKVVVVPSSSIITRGRDKFVFTVVNGTAKRTKVNVRNIQGNIAEISSGLMENDFVAVQGAGNLYDGATVDVWRR